MRAVADGEEHLVLRDGSGLLLPEGPLRLGLSATSSGTWHWADTVDGRGAVSARWQTRLERDARGARVDGELAVTFAHGGGLRWRIELIADEGGTGAGPPRLGKPSARTRPLWR